MVNRQYQFAITSWSCSYLFVVLAKPVCVMLKVHTYVHVTHCQSLSTDVSTYARREED